MAFLALAALALGVMGEARERSVAYHARIRERLLSFHPEIPGWRASSIDAPLPCLPALRLNVLASRKLVEEASGREATVLLAQSRRVEDLLGYAPPGWYLARGWTADGSEAKEWHVGRRRIYGREEAFSFRRPDGTAEVIAVSRFFVSPAGLAARDFQDLRAATRRILARGYGGAIFVVETAAGGEPRERDALVSRLIEAFAPVLDVIAPGFAEVGAYDGQSAYGGSSDLVSDAATRNVGREP